MSKKTYIAPVAEVYDYRVERGFEASLTLKKDYVLVGDGDTETLRSDEEVTEYTDANSEYTMGIWN